MKNFEAAEMDFEFTETKTDHRLKTRFRVLAQHSKTEKVILDERATVIKRNLLRASKTKKIEMRSRTAFYILTGK